MLVFVLIHLSGKTKVTKEVMFFRPRDKRGEKFEITRETDRSVLCEKSDPVHRFIKIGASFVFGSYGVISADYEFANYSSIKMKESDSYDTGVFDQENILISDDFQLASNFRIGMEFRPSPLFAIRAGYSLYQSPERDFDQPINFLSAGVGFRGNRGFFADFGIQRRLGTSENFSLYNDYRSNVASPTGEMTRTGVRILTTIGFRF